MARALASYDFVADTEAALERMADNELESMILHELGEARAGALLGEAWRDMTLSLARTKGELVARAVRDLLADCLSTLPELLKRANLPALHFYFATFDAQRRQLFPQVREAYEHFLCYGTLDRLWHVVNEGQERWLAVARALLALDTVARESAMEALLQDASARAGASSVSSECPVPPIDAERDTSEVR